MMNVLEGIVEGEEDHSDVTPRGQLPFPFSKKHNLVVFYEDEKSDLCFKEQPSAELILEVRRCIRAYLWFDPSR